MGEARAKAWVSPILKRRGIRGAGRRPGGRDEASVQQGREARARSRKHGISWDERAEPRGTSASRGRREPVQGQPNDGGSGRCRDDTEMVPGRGRVACMAEGSSGAWTRAVEGGARCERSRGPSWKIWRLSAVEDERLGESAEDGRLRESVGSLLGGVGVLFGRSRGERGCWGEERWRGEFGPRPHAWPCRTHAWPEELRMSGTTGAIHDWEQSRKEARAMLGADQNEKWRQQVKEAEGDRDGWKRSPSGWN